MKQGVMKKAETWLWLEPAAEGRAHQWPHWWQTLEKFSEWMVAHLLLNLSACLFDEFQCDLSFSLEAKDITVKNLLSFLPALSS